MLLTTQRSLSLLNKLNWFFSLYCAIFLNSSYGLWFCSREKLGGQYIIFVLLEFQVLVDIELNLLFPTSTKWNQLQLLTCLLTLTWWPHMYKYISNARSVQDIFYFQSSFLTFFGWICFIVLNQTYRCSNLHKWSTLGWYWKTNLHVAHLFFMICIKQLISRSSEYFGRLHWRLIILFWV